MSRGVVGTPVSPRGSAALGKLAVGACCGWEDKGSLGAERRRDAVDFNGPSMYQDLTNSFQACPSLFSPWTQASYVTGIAQRRPIGHQGVLHRDEQAIFLPTSGRTSDHSRTIGCGLCTVSMAASSLMVGESIGACGPGNIKIESWSECVTCPFWVSYFILFYFKIFLFVCIWEDVNKPF